MTSYGSRVTKELMRVVNEFSVTRIIIITELILKVKLLLGKFKIGSFILSSLFQFIFGQSQKMVNLTFYHYTHQRLGGIRCYRENCQIYFDFTVFSTNDDLTKRLSHNTSTPFELDIKNTDGYNFKANMNFILQNYGVSYFLFYKPCIG